MTHTPGPWNINSEDARVITAPDGDMVAVCEYISDGDGDLIAAAPEMRKTIESLLAVLDVFVAYNTYFPLGDGIVRETLRDARGVAKRAGSDDYGEEYADES